MRQFIGDFSTNEIESFGVRDSELIVKILIAKACNIEKHYVLKAAEYHMKAIDVIEFAPFFGATRDRSIIFTCFHSLFRFLREGKLERDFAFERGLAARFAQSSEGDGSFHRACALALNAEMKARSGLPREALKEFDSMTAIYKMENYSEDVKAVSGNLDVCALAMSRSALWFMQLGDEENAMKQYEFVIAALPAMKSTDAGEMHAILTPIISIARGKVGKRSEGFRVKKLYEVYVERHVRDSKVPFYVRNMTIILNSYEGSDRFDMTDADISWALSDENRQVSHDFDLFYISLGMSLNSLLAEVCLSSVYHRRDSPNLGAIIEKGLTMATFAGRSMKKNNTFIWANERNRAVLSELQSIAKSIGFSPTLRLLGRAEESGSQRTKQRRSAFQL